MTHPLPTGVITFLFTDIEGSTQLWERHPETMKAALARHDELLRRAIETHNGRVVKTTGDGCHAVFASAADAVAAVIDIQRTLRADDGPQTTDHRQPHERSDPSSVVRGRRTGIRSSVESNPPLTIKVRIGLHTGEAELRDGDYYGSAVNRAARIMSIGHGGQVLVSATTAGLIRDTLPPGVSLRDLGDHRLRDLSRPSHIYQVTIDGLTADFPPLRSLDILPGNLPVQVTSFVGRERELTEVKQLLATTRLLTLTGPGGTGKTRLSLQAAADLQTGFAHGAWLVELAPLADPALVSGAVAALFSLTPQPGLSLSDALHDYLRGKHLLLVLDNCEHLVEACARLAADLLAVAPRLTILASSREGLGNAGETTYHVPTLELPAMSDRTAAAVCRHDAADLFLQRARAARPGFAVTDANAPAIAQIVRRLDGIPLAIELAAARIRLLSPEQIAARLDDRFRLLTGGSRTALPRQQTLRALIDWSYDLLDEREKWFFRQLGVFVGGWTLEAAEAIGDLSGFGNLTGLDAFDLLSGLVNKSLVIVDEGGNTVRYHYLETIRQYARDKLFESGEGELARDRHFDYFYHDILDSDPFKKGGVTLTLLAYSVFYVAEWWLAHEEDLDNLRAAVEWGNSKDPERALSMAARLAFALTTSRTTGADLVRASLAAVEALPPAVGTAAITRTDNIALAKLALAFTLMGIGDFVVARINLEQTAHLARRTGNDGYRALALVQRSLTGLFLNADDTASDGQEAADVYRALNSPLGEAQAMSQVAAFYYNRGEFELARPLAEQALAIGRAYDEKDPIAAAMNYMTWPRLAQFAGDIPLAEAQFRTAAATFRRYNSRFFAMIMESDLAHMLRQVGRPDDARPIYHKVIREWQDLGRRAAVANMLENFAFMARAEGQPERAAQLLGAAEAIRDEIQVDMTPWEREEYEQETAALREALPAQTLTAEWAIGRAFTLDEAVDYAVEM